MNESNDKKYVFPNGKIMTRKEIFESKERFHREQAKLSYKEKVEIVMNLQKIARSIRGHKI